MQKRDDYMELYELFKDRAYHVKFPSINDTLESKLDFYKYEHLYNYFYKKSGEVYHSLAGSNYAEEYYLVTNYSKLQLEDIHEYGLDYKMSNNLLTINIALYDEAESPLEVSFIYDLNSLDTLFELSVFLKQTEVDLFFLEMLNNKLYLEGKINIVLLHDFKMSLKSSIENYINSNIGKISAQGVYEEKEIVYIEASSLTKEINEEIRDFKTYNWVDVRYYAETIFYNYEFEMPWAEDAWNIVMFNDIVKSDNINPASCSDCDEGDMIIWLAALYDIYHEYKIAADYEYDERSPMEHIERIYNVKNYISSFLKVEVYKELNRQLLEGSCSEQEFYDVSEDAFVFEDYYDEPSIAYEVFYKEVKKRREMIYKIFYKYFRRNTVLISRFMEGTHWCDNYLMEAEKRQAIEDKYDKILEQINKGKVVVFVDENSEYEYEDEDSVCKDMEYELEEFENEILKYKSNAQTGRVYDWISKGMSF
jgi:hypothetical protein